MPAPAPALPRLPLPARVEDRSAVWERIAAAAFAAPDGLMEGWDSGGEGEAKESGEAKYIKVQWRGVGRRGGRCGRPVCS